MRKLYTLLAASAVAVSASAAFNLGSYVPTFSPKGAIDASAPISLKVAGSEALKTIASDDLVVAKTNSAKVPSLSQWSALDEPAKYTDDIFTVFTGIEGKTYEVTVEKHATTDGLYRLVNPYKQLATDYNLSYDSTTDHYIVLHGESGDGHFYIEDFETGVTISDDYANIAITTQVGSMVDSYGYSTLYSYYPTGFGDVSNGIYTYGTYMTAGAKSYYNFLMKTGGTSGTTIAGANLNGNFKVALPGSSDYTYEVTAPLCAGETVTLSATLGSDLAGIAAKAYAPITTNDEYKAAYTDLFSASDATYVKGNGALEVKVPLTQDGTNSVVYCVVDSEGNVKGVYFLDVTKVIDNADQWTSIGNGQYTDVIGAVAGLVSEAQTYDVEVQQNIGTPTIYRLVNAYQSENAPANYTKYNEADHSDHNHYIVLDVTDPEAVDIELTALGVNWGGGEFEFCGKAYFYMNMSSSAITADAAKEAGYFGTYTADTRTINFGPGNLFYHVDGTGSYWYAPSTTTYTETNFKVVLPDPAGVEAIAIDNSNAPVEYFNLQGVRVENPSAGLFIRRQGNVVTKTVVK
jgi:hypothetical protein